MKRGYTSDGRQKRTSTTSLGLFIDPTTLRRPWSERDTESISSWKSSSESINMTKVFFEDSRFFRTAALALSMVTRLYPLRISEATAFGFLFIISSSMAATFQSTSSTLSLSIILIFSKYALTSFKSFGDNTEYFRISEKTAIQRMVSQSSETISGKTTSFVIFWMTLAIYPSTRAVLI